MRRPSGKPSKLVVLSGGLRWEREQLPPPLAALANPELPLTEKLPSLGNNWGPRIEHGRGKRKKALAGLPAGLRNVLWAHGEPEGGDRAHPDRLAQRRSELLHAAHRRSANSRRRRSALSVRAGGEPDSIVKPGAVEFAPNFHNPEVHQAVAAVEEKLPGHVEVTASAMVSLGRRLPVSIDTNLRPRRQSQTITYAVEDASRRRDRSRPRRSRFPSTLPGPPATSSDRHCRPAQPGLPADYPDHEPRQLDLRGGDAAGSSAMAAGG